MSTEVNLEALIDEYYSSYDVIGFLLSAGKKPFYHQLDLISDLIIANPIKVLIADDVGLGKTIEALAFMKYFLNERRRSAEPRRVLVIAPPGLINQWIDEIKNFGFNDTEISVIDTPSQILADKNIYIVSMDRAKRAEYFDRLKSFKWDLVVVDEAHKIRLGRERVKIAQLCQQAESCLLLTATPHTGNAKDFKLLSELVNGLFIRREKRDVEQYEGKKIFKDLEYWIIEIKASRDEGLLLAHIIRLLEDLTDIEPIIRTVAIKRALSSPIAFIKTLASITRGSCTVEDIEEGELDGCIGQLPGREELKKKLEVYVHEWTDRKLEALKELLKGPLRNRRVVLFTEYATTAEYLFKELSREFNCSIEEESEGYGCSNCQDGYAFMYTTYKARMSFGNELNDKIEVFAKTTQTPVLITTDIFSEGVNLQVFDTVINYEVVWSPIKHIQRIGRVWRLGQESDKVLVIDMVLNVYGFEKSEFEYYVKLFEKFYEINLRAMTPQAYGIYSLYKFSKDGLERILSFAPTMYLREAEIFETLYRGDDESLNRIKRLVEDIARARENMRTVKPGSIAEHVYLKIGYRRDLHKPEPGSGYYLALLRVVKNGKDVYREPILVRLHTPLSKVRRVKGDTLYRFYEVDWLNVKTEPGEIKDDERRRIESIFEKSVRMKLQAYLSAVKRLFGDLGDIDVYIQILSRAFVIPSEEAYGDFEKVVDREIWYNRKRVETEMKAVELIKEYLIRNGFRIVSEYMPIGPFDFKVVKDGVVYTVECKGRRVYDDYSKIEISLTANEFDWGSKYPDRHLICIAYIPVNGRPHVECLTFREFQKKWKFEIQRGLEYRIIAYREE